MPSILQFGDSPAGIVLPYAGSSSPDGWLLCNGAAVNRVTYARLFAAIGTAYGVGDGVNTFNLPNTQGVFLRGAGSQVISSKTYTGTLGAKADDTTKKNSLALSGTTSFSSTGHTHGTPNHNHRWIMPGGGASTIGGGFQSAVFDVNGGTFGAFNSMTAYTDITGGGTTGGPSAGGTVGLGNGDDETRPANLGINYIIKI